MYDEEKRVEVMSVWWCIMSPSDSDEVSKTDPVMSTSSGPEFFILMMKTRPAK